MLQFDLAIKSLPWTVVHMLFFYLVVGVLGNFRLGELTFTAGGFVIFYIATYWYLRSLRP